MDLPSTLTEIRELDRRLAAHAAHPEDAVPWETVKARALDRARR